MVTIAMDYPTQPMISLSPNTQVDVGRPLAAGSREKAISFTVDCNDITPRPWNEAMGEYFGQMGLAAKVIGYAAPNGYIISVHSDDPAQHAKIDYLAELFRRAGSAVHYKSPHAAPAAIADIAGMPSSIEHMLKDWNAALKKCDEHPHAHLQAQMMIGPIRRTGSRAGRSEIISSDVTASVKDTNDEVHLLLAFARPKIASNTRLVEGLRTYAGKLELRLDDSDPRRLTLHAPEGRERTLLHIAALFQASHCCDDLREGSFDPIEMLPQAAVPNFPRTLDDLLKGINRETAQVTRDTLAR